MNKTMDDIVLSVVIPCYNEKDTIETVLDAVRNCGVKNLEIIVVDDCSKDGTRDLLQGPLRSKIDRLIFHKGNGEAQLRHSLRMKHGVFQKIQQHLFD